MANESDDISSAFISYHHDDRVIGEEIKTQLTNLAAFGTGKPHLATFLDAKDIPPGRPWKPSIDENLANKDWLVIVFTGEQSTYCGYEFGTFSQLHKESTATRIITLHDVSPTEVPSFLSDSQNSAIPPVGEIVQPQNVKVSADELTLWFESSIARFLKEFCSYKKLYTPEDAKDNPSSYAANIALAAKCISAAFSIARGSDVKAETPTQISFELTVKGIGDSKLESIHDAAAIVGTSVFFATLGLAVPLDLRGQAPSTTWGELKNLLGTQARKEVPWLHKVETDVVRAASNLAVSGDEVTFRGENGKIYRPVMVRHQLFVNSDRKFYLLLLETLDRRFVGRKEMSLVLTGLVLASRWRFSYFERWEHTVNRIFGEGIPIANFADSCRQLIYNIEWIEHEAAQLGADNMEALVDAFGPDHRARVERFFTDWETAKKELFAGLPALNIPVTTDNRGEIRKTIIAFLEKTQGQNADFLQLAIATYSDEMQRSLSKDRGTPQE